MTNEKTKGCVKESGSDKALEIFRRKFIRSVEALPAKVFPMQPPSSLQPGSPVSTRPDLSKSQPIKVGVLLKKRDLLTGWKSRYFKVHYGRLDYYENKDDIKPRGSIDLIGARITQTGLMTINNSDHWTIMYVSYCLS